MNQYRTTPAGLDYLAESLSEMTGRAHDPRGPAVFAAAAQAEESASNNGGLHGAQVEVRGAFTLSRRPEIIYLDDPAWMVDGSSAVELGGIA